MDRGHYKGTPVAFPGVVVACGELGGVGARFEPPVHPCQLGAQRARRLKLVHDLPVRPLPMTQLFNQCSNITILASCR